MVKMNNLEELTELLEKMKAQYGVDGFKVYYLDKESFCVKGIKEEQVVCIKRKKGKAWDLKK